MIFDITYQIPSSLIAEKMLFAVLMVDIIKFPSLCVGSMLDFKLNIYPPKNTPCLLRSVQINEVLTKTFFIANCCKTIRYIPISNLYGVLS